MLPSVRYGSHRRMRVSDLPRLDLCVASLVLLAASGCIPSVVLGPSTTVRQDCRGEFDAELVATRDGGRKVKLVFELLPGDENLADFKLSPDRAQIKGKKKTETVNLSGSLVDACADGGVSVLASYAPTGTSGYFGIVAMVDPAPVEARSDSTSGTFSYPVVMQCCGEASAAAFDVAALGGQGVADVAVEPARFECAGDEQHTLTVSGTVTTPGKTGTVEVSVTHAEAGTMCSFTDPVEPGATSAAATPPTPVDDAEDGPASTPAADETETDADPG